MNLPPKLRHSLVSIPLIASIAAVAAETAPPSEWNILAHGAVADSTLHSTAAIQRRIDAAHDAGRGTINGQAVREWRSLGEVDSFIAAETETARQAGSDMKRPYNVKLPICLLAIRVEQR